MSAYRSKSKTINDYFEKGVNAFNKGNYEYAIEMLLQVVQEEPRFTEAREKLHEAERENHKKNPPSLISLIMVKLNNLIPLALASVASAKQDYKKAIAFYEDILRYEPTNISYLRKLYNLGLKAEWLDVALVSLESLFMLNPKNADIAQNLGNLYRDTQEIEKAAYYYKKSLEINPINQKVSKSLKDLEALRTIKTGGWDQKGSYRAKLQDEEESQKFERDAKMATDDSSKDAKFNEMKTALSQNSDAIAEWLKFIDFCIDTEKHEEAEEFIKDAQAKFPNDEGIASRSHAVKKKLSEKKINILQEKIAKMPANETLKKELAAEQKKQVILDIEELENRTTLYPNDLALKYDLGEAYYAAANFDKALAQFQQAVKDPAVSTRALNKLGLSFHKKGMHDLAVLQFQKAIDKTPGINATSKDIIYNLGITIEAMGKREEAITEFKKIYEADIAYRDVAKKIEEFYKK